MTTLIDQIQTLTRWSEWATSKLPFLISCLLITQLQAAAQGQKEDVAAMGLLFLQLCLMAAYGFMLNAYCDVESDGVAGKANAFARIGRTAGTRLLGRWLAAAAALALLQFFSDGPVLLLLAACYSTATAYSVPPLRLKERGVLGLVAASAAQRLLPVILIFQALGTWTPAAFLLCILNGLVGLRYILAHQIADHNADRRSGTATFTTNRGIESMRRLGRFTLLPLEVATLLSTLVLLQKEIPLLGWFIPAYLTVLAGYLLFLPPPRMRVVDGSTYAPFSGLYNIFMPLYLAVLFSLSGPADGVASLAVPIFIAIWLIPEMQEKVRILFGER